jgi:uncharacterized protein (TIGR00369 family)
MQESNEENLQELSRRFDMGFVKAMGYTFVAASEDEIIMEWTVAEQHVQPYGIVHGGVHAGVIETLCTIGAGIAARKRGHKGSVVGLENHTSFLRAVGLGARLHARAVPITRGRTTHVWEAEVTDPNARVIARGSVRLLCVERDALAGASR